MPSSNCLFIASPSFRGKLLIGIPKVSISIGLRSFQSGAFDFRQLSATRAFDLAASQRVIAIKANFAPQREKTKKINSDLLSSFLSFEQGKLRREKKVQLNCGGHLLKYNHWSN